MDDEEKNRRKASRKKYKAANKEKIRLANKAYREANKEKIKLYSMAYSGANKEKKKEYRIKNKKKIKKAAKEYREANKDKRREYFKANKDKINKQVRLNRANKINNDPLFKLKENIRGLIRKKIKEKKYTKYSKTSDILGCSYDEFMIHLNDNEYGFKHGDKNLDLDHIIPISSANTEKELLQLNHYTNFQLLPSEYNRKIKRDNKWDKENFNKYFNLNYEKRN